MKSLVFTTVHIPTPEPFHQDPSWWKMEIDRDTIKYQLAESNSWEASVGSAYAEALYYEEEADRQASFLENKTFLVYKLKPHKKLSKNKEFVMNDGSDDFAKASSRILPEAVNLRALALAWKRRRVELERVLKNFDKKSVYLASLAGVLRGELEMQSRG